MKRRTKAWRQRDKRLRESILWSRMSRPKRKRLSYPHATRESESIWPTPAEVAAFLREKGITPVTAQECMEYWLLEREFIPGVKELVDVPDNWLKIRGWGQKAEHKPRAKKSPSRKYKETCPDPSREAACQWLMVKLPTWKSYRKLRSFRNPRHEAWLSDCFVAILEADQDEVTKSKHLGIALPPYRLFREHVKKTGKLPACWGKLFRTLAFHRLTEGFDVGEKRRATKAEYKKRYKSDQFWDVLLQTECDSEDLVDLSEITTIVTIAKAIGLTKEDTLELRVLCTLCEMPNADRVLQAKEAEMGESTFYKYKAKLNKRMLEHVNSCN